MRPTTTNTNTPSTIATISVSETAMATADPVPGGGVMLGEILVEEVPETDQKGHTLATRQQYISLAPLTLV